MSRIIALLALGVLPFVSTACDKVPLLAPTDSTISLSVNTTTLPLSGTAQVTAVVLESGGTAPQNGTVVTFTTTLGQVDPVEARTTNGLASTTFHAGTRSGTATIRGFSGGAAGGETDSSVDVFVGGAAEGLTLALGVEGSSGNGTITRILASVLDANSNPIANIPVAFTSNRGVITPGLVNTDGQGEARTTLTTSETTEVTARVSGQSQTLTINLPGTFDLTITSPASGTPAEVGQVVTFSLAPSSDSVFNDVVVDFGDNTPPQSLGRVTATRTFQHTFAQRGTYTVTARGTTPTGALATASVIIQVNDRSAVGVSLTATPNPVTLTAQQGLVAFTATPTFPTNTALSRVDWTFGDGRTERSTALTNSNRYTAAGTYVATVTVTANDGRQGTASITIRVIAP